MILLLVIVIFIHSVTGISFGYNPEEPFQTLFTGLIETAISLF